MTTTLSASSVPIVMLPLSEASPASRGWQITDYAYRGYPVYQNMNDGHLAFEADGTHLVQLPDAVENMILDSMMLDMMYGDYRPEGAPHA